MIDKILGTVAMVAVVIFFMGCMVYLKKRERARLMAIPQKDRLPPAVDAPVSRYRCDETGAPHCHDNTGHCIDCGSKQ